MSCGRSREGPLGRGNSWLGEVRAAGQAKRPAIAWAALEGPVNAPLEAHTGPFDRDPTPERACLRWTPRKELALERGLQAGRQRGPGCRQSRAAGLRGCGGDSKGPIIEGPSECPGHEPPGGLGWQVLGKAPS